jgi:hypothetical protein
MARNRPKMADSILKKKNGNSPDLKPGVPTMRVAAVRIE